MQGLPVLVFVRSYVQVALGIERNLSHIQRDRQHHNNSQASTVSWQTRGVRRKPGNEIYHLRLC